MSIPSRNKSGFTLIELVIIAAVLGMIWIIGYPRYQTLIVKARQTEAKNTLAMIFSMQEAYYKSNSRYADLDWYGKEDCNGKVKNELGFTLHDCNAMRYRYKVNADGATGYVATAESTAPISDCNAKDTWQINEKKSLTSVKDVTRIKDCN